MTSIVSFILLVGLLLIYIESIVLSTLKSSSYINNT